MQVVFIHGPAACGKFTIATEVARMSGYRLFHNHLTVDLDASLFEFGSPPFVALRESIWLASMRQAAEVDDSIVFTFQPEASVPPNFPERVIEEVTAAGEEDRGMSGQGNRSIALIRSSPIGHRFFTEEMNLEERRDRGVGSLLVILDRRLQALS